MRKLGVSGHKELAMGAISAGAGSVNCDVITGSTMRSAIAVLKLQQPARLIVAIPVAPPETCDAVRTEVDEVVCLMKPEAFYAIGLWYEDFSQTTDEVVRDLLGKQTVRSQRSVV